ncbi:MAG: B12-binding domain-containing radical SAM protein [Saccharofermentanales bacterium]
MKVLLVRPPAPNTLSFIKVLDNEPLELEYLHTALCASGHEDYIYDGLIEEQSIEDTIIRERPDAIAITGYITQEKLMMAYASAAKKINPAIATVIGGVHAQLNYVRLYHEDVDYIARSESMEAFIALIRYIGDKEGRLEEINGLCYKETGGYKTVPLVPSDINLLPVPDRTFFYRNRHHYRYLDLTEVATIKTSFSCPYGCNFCYCTLLAGGRYAVRDMDLVIQELEALDYRNVQIVDDDFLVDPARLWEFIRLVRERGIQKTFLCYARADFVAGNPEIVQALADIGFRYFLVGLEAVTDSELSGYNKKTSVDANRRCVGVIHAAGAECIGLMIAPIGADRKYFRELYDWIVENQLKYVTVSIFTPIPGTPLYEEYKTRLITDDIEDWDFLHLVLKPERLTAGQFYREYYKLFLKLYRIARKTGIYDFMDLKFYKNMLTSYLKRKMRDSA